MHVAQLAMLFAEIQKSGLFFLNSFVDIVPQPGLAVTVMKGSDAVK
jgi:hypothetical protein